MMSSGGGLALVFAAGDADGAVGLGANPVEVAGDVRLLAQGVEGVQFGVEGAVAEEAVQRLVAGLAEIHDFTPALRTGDEVVAGDVTHVAFTQGAAGEAGLLARDEGVNGRAAFHDGSGG